MEPGYWRDRLEELDAVRQQLLIVPRPDLSGNGKDVVEFRIKAHDGARLWGLLARPAWMRSSDRPAQVRVVGPAERPIIDREAVEDGSADLVFQELAGRRLEDRVLDVVRICQMARCTEGIDGCQVQFATPEDQRPPDEFLIAQQLMAGCFI